MSLTRQPVQSAPQTAPPTTGWAPVGGDVLGMLGALGNQAVQSLLGAGQPDPDRHDTGASTPWLAWSAAFGGGEGAPAPVPVAENPGFSIGDAGPVTPAAAPTNLDLFNTRQLTFEGIRDNRWYNFGAPEPKANSPLIENLWAMDPYEAIARSGLPKEQWSDAYMALTYRTESSWTGLGEAFGEEGMQGLLAASAENKVSQNLGADGLTSLFTDNMPDPEVWGRQPSNKGIQKALAENLPGSVTSVKNPTNAEMAALFATNRVGNAYPDMHGLPRELFLRVGDTQDYAWQPSSVYTGPAGASANLETVVPASCYAACGDELSFAGQLQAQGVSVIGTNPALYVPEADLMVQTASSLQAQGVDPITRLEATKAALEEFSGTPKGAELWESKAYDAARTYDRASTGNTAGGKDPTIIKGAMDNESPGLLAEGPGSKKVNEAFFLEEFQKPGGNTEVFEGTRRATPVETPVVQAPVEGGTQLALPGLDAEAPTTAPKAGGFNLLEDGMAAFGLLTGGVEAFGGASDVVKALGGQTDGRDGATGAASLLSGGANVLQSAITLAGKVPSLAPALAQVPALTALAKNPNLGMLSALPSVTGYAWDVLTGADRATQALSGGNAVESVVGTALATYGGPVGVAVSMGNGLGAAGYDALFDPAEGSPGSLGELGGMLDYCVDEVCAQATVEATLLEMAHDRRATDPNANALQQTAGAAAASIGQIGLMADYAWNNLWGTPDQSILARTVAQPAAPAAPAQATTTPASSALTAGD